MLKIFVNGVGVGGGGVFTAQIDGWLSLLHLPAELIGE